MPDLVTAIVGGIARAHLPQGSTLAECSIHEGRLDVLISHGLSFAVASADNPILAAVYAAARPMLDGALVGAIGPAASAPPIKASGPKRRRTKAVARTHKRRVERTEDGREILDAEFVDVVGGRK